MTNLYQMSKKRGFTRNFITFLLNFHISFFLSVPLFSCITAYCCVKYFTTLYVSAAVKYPYGQYSFNKITFLHFIPIICTPSPNLLILSPSFSLSLSLSLFCCDRTLIDYIYFAVCKPKFHQIWFELIVISIFFKIIYIMDLNISYLYFVVILWIIKQSTLLFQEVWTVRAQVIFLYHQYITLI